MMKGKTKTAKSGVMSPQFKSKVETDRKKESKREPDRQDPEWIFWDMRDELWDEGDQVDPPPPHD